jgi:NTE family protein
LLKSDAAVTDPLARLRTRVNPFSEEEQGHLINWGWYVMDLAMRSYAVSGEVAPQAWPLPDWPP